MANNEARGGPVPSPSDPKMSGNDRSFIDGQTAEDKREQADKDMPSGSNHEDA